MRESISEPELVLGADVFPGATRRKTMGGPLRGLAQAVRAWSISLVAEARWALPIVDPLPDGRQREVLEGARS